MSPSSLPIKIFICDDHEIARQGLKVILNDGMEMSVVGEADSCDEALRLIPETAIDIVLMDVKMPVKDGFYTLAALKSMGIQAPVLMLTGYDEEAFLLEGIKGEASGLITKDSPKDFIRNSIKLILTGGVVWQSSIFEKLRGRIKDLANAAENNPLEHQINPKLSSREMQVLTLIGKGHSNKQVGADLGITEITVKKLVSNIFRKTGTYNRTQIALLAVSDKGTKI
ncbi:MAG: response regulator transcription factor [Dehalogenimonas sp.]